MFTAIGGNLSPHSNQESLKYLKNMCRLQFHSHNAQKEEILPYLSFNVLFSKTLSLIFIAPLKRKYPLQPPDQNPQDFVIVSFFSTPVGTNLARPAFPYKTAHLFQVYIPCSKMLCFVSGEHCTFNSCAVEEHVELGED